MDLKIQFIIPYGRKFTISKTFRDKNHYDNFIQYMKRKHRYHLDEVWEVNPTNH